MKLKGRLLVVFLEMSCRLGSKITELALFHLYGFDITYLPFIYFNVISIPILIMKFLSKVGSRAGDPLTTNHQCVIYLPRFYTGVAITKIFQSLGAFTNEVEIKRMLKTLLPNLESTSAVTRRTAATSLTAICQVCTRE